MSFRTRRVSSRHRSTRPTAEHMEARALLNGAWGGYAGNAQHTALSTVASQPLESIHWQAPVDLNPQFSGNDLFIHYGTPAITSFGTMLLPVKTGTTGGFEIQARNEQTGGLLSTISTDYVLPAHGWTPSYSPALTSTGALAMPGIGGKIYMVDAPDVNGATISRTLVFFGQNNYSANSSAYDNSVFIDTPITADSAGNLYFGFTVSGSNPLNLQSGIARIGADGTGSYVSATSAASDAAIIKVVQNAAPAVSNDGKTVYFAVSSGSFSSGDLLALNSTTLATTGKVALMDPKSGSNSELPDDGTASPMVGPDGDVYFGVLENPYASNHDRGWLLHFNSTLTQSKTVGAFGWDDTPSLVPTSMVPGYTGTSTYLLMAKYNNYADGLGGDGVNRIAVLDPNAPMIDPPSGVSTMRPVLSIAGVTPDPANDATNAFAVREWCINTAVVDPATDSILANSEDGKLYRWNLLTDTFSQVITLTPGLGEAYTPTIIGPDGAVFAINNATIFAIGANPTPVASADLYSLNEDAALTVNATQGVLANDSDGGGKLSLSAALVSGPSHGVLALNADGSFLYTPLTHYSGTDSFAYKATDGQKTSVATTVSLTINLVDHAPVAVADNYSLNEDNPLTISAPGVLANDTDIDPNTTLTAMVFVNPSHGIVTLNSDGSFVYTPTALYSGTDSFGYRASDGTLSSATATVSLTINPVNHPPQANPDSYSMAEGSSLAVSSSLGVLKNDTNTNPNTTLSAFLLTAPAHGTATLFIDGSFTYTPSPLYSGVDSFTYRASDGLATSDSKASITVTAINHAPTTVADSFTVAQESTLTVTSPGVLANDTVVDPSPSLTAVVNTMPTNGTLNLHLDGSFVYTPNIGFRGSDSFTYHAVNGVLPGNVTTVSMTVTPVNHPPTANPDTFSLKENKQLVIFADQGVLANDTDVDPNTTLSAILTHGPSHGTLTLNTDGSFAYTPTLNSHGDDSFNYEASDGLALSAPVSVLIHVQQVNQLPVASGRAFSLTQGRTSPIGLVVASFTDVDFQAASSYTAFVDWGDGTPATAGSVTLLGGVYNITGSHEYDSPGSYLAKTSIVDLLSGTVSALSTATVAPIGVALTAAPALTGNRAADGAIITNINKPTITGTAPAGFVVNLYTNSGALIGQGTAGADNSFAILASPLADGAVSFNLTATDPAAGSHLVLSAAAASSLDIDTQAPKITSTSFDLSKGTVTISFQDPGYGLDLSMRPQSQHFAVKQVIKGRTTNLTVVSIDTTGFGSSQGSNSVTLTLKKSHLPKGAYSITAAPGTIRDLAGNPLPGGISSASIKTKSHHPQAPRFKR